MNIGKIFISKIYKTYDRFVLGFSFEITYHVHYKNEGNYQDIVKTLLKEVDETVIMVECLFWGIDIQISNL